MKYKFYGKMKFPLKNINKLYFKFEKIYITQFLQKVLSRFLETEDLESYKLISENLILFWYSLLIRRSI